jgi:hypothetical protein
MAQFALAPPPTKEELERIWQLMDRRKKEKGFRTWREVAAAVGIHQSELSRLRRADTERRWGYWRLIRLAKWLELTIDQMLGRREGTTQQSVSQGGQRLLEPILEAQAFVEQSRLTVPFRVTGPGDLQQLLGDAWPCPHCGRPIDLEKAIRAKRNFLQKSLRRIKTLERERKGGGRR